MKLNISWIRTADCWNGRVFSYVNKEVEIERAEVIIGSSLSIAIETAIEKIESENRGELWHYERQAVAIKESGLVYFFEKNNPASGRWNNLK